jgi:choice-of-anchor B domain-containing protein
MVLVEQVPVSLSHEVVQVGLGRIGANFALRPVALDFNGSPITIPSDFTYSSSAPATVGVDVNGILTAYDFGTAAITIERMGLQTTVGATVGGITGDDPILDQPAPCTGGLAGPFECDRVDLVAYLPLTGLGAEPGIEVTDVWGWRDSVTLREYALVGRTDGVVFVDVTTPAHPRTIAWMPAAIGPTSARVRAYRDHAYVVGQNTPGHGVQIFDLTRLREIDRYTAVTEDERYVQVSDGLSIGVDEASGRGFVAGSEESEAGCGIGLHFLSLSDPGQTTFAGCFLDTRTGLGGTGLTLDAHCVEYLGPDTYVGREICVGANQTAVSIADVTDPNAPVALSVGSHPTAISMSDVRLSEDHGYLFQGDEDDELRALLTGNFTIPTQTFIWDVSDLDAPILVRTYEGPSTATDFQSLVLGTTLFMANGDYGLRLLDVIDPPNPVEAGFFDTYVDGDSPSTQGAQASYPYFGAGLVLVASRREGLFVLRVQP